MKKLLLIGLLFGVLIPASAAFAYPFCGPTQPPNQPSGFCRYDLVANDTHRVQTGVSFVWLRNAPSSTADILATVRPSAGPSLVTVGGVAHWDGVQWWYEMATYPDRRVTGWVERVSLAQVVTQSAPEPLSPTPTPVPGVNDPSIQLQAAWTAPFNARVEAGVPFLWMREAPNSGRVVATLGAGEQFVVTNGPQFDGYQWWWPVANIHRTRGWVEQGSITPIG
jgi:hypothetical protein